MNIERGDMTVGDIGVSFIATADETLTDKNVDFIFLKPSGETIRRDATSISGYTATYNTVSGDIDEAGTWYVYLKYETAPYYYTKESGNRFYVRPRPEDMAVIQ